VTSNALSAHQAIAQVGKGLIRLVEAARARVMIAANVVERQAVTAVRVPGAIFRHRNAQTAPAKIGIAPSGHHGRPELSARATTIA
jgi:hypothetical protein